MFGIYVDNLVGALYIMQFYYFRPVRLRMNLKTNMEMVGKRYPYVAKYKVCSIKISLTYLSGISTRL